MTSVRLCICKENEGGECKIGKIENDQRENLFSTLKDLEDRLGEGLIKREKDEHCNGDWECDWKDDKVEDCYMYYIFTFANSGKRVREHDKLVSGDRTSHSFPKICKTVFVFALFKTESTHEFVDIRKATGFGQFNLMIDLLSMVKQTDRKPEKRAPVYFGFLYPSKERREGETERDLFNRSILQDHYSENVIRVAVKRETDIYKTLKKNKEEILEQNEENAKNIRSKITQALKFANANGEERLQMMTREIHHPSCNTKEKIIQAIEGALSDVAEKREEKLRKIRHEIDVALKAGGKYNMKYLACTDLHIDDDTWIAMELCRMETLDTLISMKDEKYSYIIDHDKLKICFMHILLGLAHLHSKNISHQEMVMENILLSLDLDVLKIGDYDHVKQVGRQTKDELQQQQQHLQEDVCMTTYTSYRCLRRDKETKVLSEYEKKIANDVEKTGEMFFKCLKRDSRCDLKPLTDLTSCDDTDDTNFTDGVTSYDKSWIKQLKKLAKELVGDENSYLAAYLIIYIVLEKPTVEEVLNHPYFWNEYKMLSFVTRMDASFYKECGSPVLREIKSDFQSCFETLSDSSSTQKFNWHNGLEKIPESLCGKELKNEMRKILEESTKPKKNYDCSDITRFLRFIRNIHHHYHEDYTEYEEKRVKKFESTSAVWKCLNSMHPGMICLLHRVVWTRQDDLPDDLKRFFKKSKFVGKLELRMNSTLKENE